MTNDVAYILLADDDPDDQDIFVRGFADVNPGASVKTVSDGQELFEFIDSCNRAHELPVVIVIDYKMPLMTGPEILKKLASNPAYSHIPKLVWSSSERSKDIEECKRLGAKHYFQKPATCREIDDLIREINEIFTVQLNTLRC